MSGLTENSMRLFDLILLKSNVNWDYISMPRNPNISLDDIDTLTSNGLKMDKSVNPHLTIRDVLNDFEYIWDIAELSKHPNITPDIILKYKILNWDLREIAKNPNLTDDYIKNHFRIELEYITNKIKTDHVDCYCDLCEYCDCNYREYLGMNSNLSADIFINNCKTNDKLFIQPHTFITHQCITLDIITKHWDEFVRQDGEDWLYEELHRNPNLTIDFIRERADKPWDWDALTANPNIQIQEIIDNPDLGWGPDAEWWHNPNVRVYDLIKNDCMDQSMWYAVSQSPHTTIEFILEHPDFP